ncbi:hypothetical protein [Rhizobium leguminosarum]|uniref:hypothetical protein n=1 Tax=Rhizobium TaxID=379 RepID=UPI0013B81C1E|nr:hypothetical protein [Rhizobium leguminosarum]WSG96536.1 hypothetical protein U8P76_06465 [Rhizobium johnstonii]MBY5320902.1 hypothetical protein [Rhizobium leguminosarum]MBY5380783.1 hypothetical protein [Rhizobium leguminosarum]MCA2432088.1 hypothetical protein [Rhizobium leguminosarum]NEH72357.1 hypothetical protein [Rhizobium leguminosarum]
MTSRSAIFVAAILRASLCQQFAGPLETCPGGDFAPTIGGPLFCLDPPIADTI